MTRTMRLMDVPEALPSGDVPSLPEAVWVNTNPRRHRQSFHRVVVSPRGLVAYHAGSDAELVWPIDEVVPYGGIATTELVAWSARRELETSEVLLQGNFNLGLLVLATYERPRDGGVGYFSREFFALDASSSKDTESPTDTDSAGETPEVFSHVDRPGSIGTAPLLGRWQNADPDARGLLEIAIEEHGPGLAVTARGRGEGDPVDWGPGKAEIFACLDEAGNASLSALATWKFDALEAELQLRVPGGTLAVAGFNVFGGERERPNYCTREFFYRV